jgi:hypothetical protein
MIVFKCPECGERMEIGNQMAGQEIECVACKETVRVPQTSDFLPAKAKTKRAKSLRATRRTPSLFGGDDDALSDQEWWMYGALFLFVPGAGAWISSILYYMWRERLPSKAAQINQLGWLIFLCVHLPVALILSCLCCLALRRP